MSPDGGVRGVVVAHGGMARGMVDAVRRITGADEGALTPLTNEGESADSLRDRLDSLVGDEETIIFVDLRTGSCATAARYVCRESPHRSAIFGVNLPVLIDFVFHRELAREELLERLLEKGRGALTSISEPASDADPAVSGR